MAPPDQATRFGDDEGKDQDTYPVYYFFYGTLINKTQLKHVLRLTEEPELRKASIFGYSLAKWGPYRTLLPGKREDMISGYAYLVTCAKHQQRLAEYETSAYKVDECRIFFADSAAPPQIEGRVFAYSGDPKDLQETG